MNQMSRTTLLALGLTTWQLAFATTALGQIRNDKPELLKITDRVYCATGFALGNVIYIRTDTSVVVVDTTESPSAARQTLDAFRTVSRLPVSAIIYTHHHGDHVNGAKAFKSETTRIIAQKNFLPEMAKYKLLTQYNRRVNATQFGATLPPSERALSLAPDRYYPVPPIIGYIAPDVLFDEKYDFEEGGVRFELYHTQGETVDHLMVWLPQEQVLLPGDLFYPSFPMLSSPMKPVRPVTEWAESLERMRTFRPAHLVGSHGRPVNGSQEIDTTLANYAKAIRYVHDETVERINKGLSLDEIRRQVRLPEELAKLPYLAPVYGRPEWAVNGIYRLYTGWYDFDPAHLNPGRSEAFGRALLEAAGGADAILQRAEKALSDRQPQLALELAGVILGGEPSHRGARAVAAKALQRLADTTENTIERNIYGAATQAHKKAAEKEKTVSP
jgi:alkyl sulfatase BDS1-like metallo-beta-lactamase superfamily hydrolase